MAQGFEPGALLGHIYELEDGNRVRLRLARGSDLAAIGELLERHGSGRLATRLVHFDPRREYVVCVTGLCAGHETVLGVGLIELDGEAGEPALLVASEMAGQEVVDLLQLALRGAAERITRARAA